MTAETFNGETIEKSPTAEQLLQLPVHKIGSGRNPEAIFPIDESLPLESRTLLKRYIEKGLNVAKETPSRVERIARGIVHEVVTMTPQKAINIGKNVAVSYAKNINPLNLFLEDWYWRGGVGLGVGIGGILTFTGARVNPWIRTGICFGFSAGFGYLAHKDYQREVSKVKNLGLSPEEEADKIAQLDKIKTKAIKINKGLSAGLAYWGIASLIETGAPAHFITEGAKLLTPSTAYAAESSPLDNYIPDDYSQDMVAAVPRVKPGFEVTEKIFGTFDKVDEVTHDYVSSTEGFIQHQIAVDDYGIKDFDPKNVEHLKLFQAEIQADPDYQNKVKAGVNAFINLNRDHMDAFLPDPKTGAIGETFSYLYEDNTPIGFKTYQNWGAFFKTDEFKHYIDGDAKLEFVNEGYKPVIEPFKGEDPVFKDWTREQLGDPTLHLENGQTMEFQPGQVSSIKGLAEALYARDYLGIKNFDPSNDQHMKLFWEATAPESSTRDFLAKARIQTIADKFSADNPTAVIHGQVEGQDVATDYFSRVDESNQPAKWKMLENYHDLAASLVDESPARDVFNNDVWTTLSFDQPDKYVESLGFSADISSLKGLAEAIFIREDLGFVEFDPSKPEHFEIVKKLIEEKYGNNPGLVDHKIQALMRYIKENNPENYFNGEQVLHKTSSTNSLTKLKLRTTFQTVLEAVS